MALYMITIVIVNARGIIHIAFRVHALSNMIKMLATPLTNSPATFQTMMNAIFASELLEGWLTIYMDDILVHTEDDLNLHRK